MGLAPIPSDPLLSFQLPQDSHRLPCPYLRTHSTHVLNVEVLTVILYIELQRLISIRPLALSPEQAPAQVFLTCPANAEALAKRDTRFNCQAVQ